MSEARGSAVSDVIGECPAGLSVAQSMRLRLGIVKEHVFFGLRRIVTGRRGRWVSDTSCFDRIFEDLRVDPERWSEIVGLIEHHAWFDEHMLEVSESEAIAVRLCRFSGIFGNGGIQYWFECDMPFYGRRTADALRVIGLRDAGDALEATHDLFPSSLVYLDRDLRIREVTVRQPEFDVFGARLWHFYDDIAWSAARWLESRRTDFAHLAYARSFDSLYNRYEPWPFDDSEDASEVDVDEESQPLERTPRQN